jgi:hypothetical protein
MNPIPRSRPALISLGLLLLLLAGCAGMQQRESQERFEARLRAFENAVRWGEFQLANALHRPGERAAPEPDYERLRKIRVTAVDLLGMQFSPAGDRVHVQTRIDYTHEYTQRVRSIVYEHDWELDVEAREWYLLTPLPELD